MTRMQRMTTERTKTRSALIRRIRVIRVPIYNNARFPNIFSFCNAEIDTIFLASNPRYSLCIAGLAARNSSCSVLLPSGVFMLSFSQV